MRLLIGLGGNQGEPRTAFDRARAALAEDGTVLECSSLYRTAPVGPPQPEYLNAVLLLETRRPPLALLDRCQAIEAAAGRDRTAERRWGPRALDLDLLLADRLVHRGARLVLPHPRLAERAFALVPAAEIAPEWVHPIVGRPLAALAAEVLRRDPAAVQRLGRWLTPP